jgi:hypothetical protein
MNNDVAIQVSLLALGRRRHVPEETSCDGADGGRRGVAEVRGGGGGKWEVAGKAPEGSEVREEATKVSRGNWSGRTIGRRPYNRTQLSNLLSGVVVKKWKNPKKRGRGGSKNMFNLRWGLAG